jgi:hypothetical protein
MTNGRQAGKYHSILMGVPDKQGEDKHGTITISPANQQSFDSSLESARKWAKAVLEGVDEKYKGVAHVSIREMKLVPVEVVTLSPESK